ncbi:hypothetical protein G6F42_014113 [Rhizopus arrhizus]|nr:hypothetical protein G6F42_014113 [Rhizopus arrhizus]
MLAWMTQDEMLSALKCYHLHLHHSEHLRKGTHDVAVAVAVAVAAGDSNSKHVVVVLDYGKISNNESYRDYGGPTHSEGENDCYDAFQTS